MKKVSLETKEVGVLKFVIREYLSELRSEIVRTEKWEMKDKLKEERELLTGLLKKLNARAKPK